MSKNHQTDSSKTDQIRLELDLVRDVQEAEALRPAVLATADESLLAELDARVAALEAAATAGIPDDYYEDDGEFSGLSLEDGEPVSDDTAAPASSYPDLTTTLDPYGFPDRSERVNKNGEVVGVSLLGTVENLQHLLATYGVTVRYNAMSKTEEIRIPGASFSTDNDANASLAALQSLCSRNKLPTKDLPAYVTLIAEQNRYHPVADWIQAVPWDGVSRIDELLSTVGVGPEHIEYKNGVLRRWLVSAVAAVFSTKPTDRFEGCLVFVGKQGLGKTSWFRRLVPSSLTATFEGANLDPANKDSVMQAAAHWIVELGEIGSTFRKADIDRIKAFLSSTRDELRQAYAHKKNSFKRRTVFCGSVNDESYLTDTTGNRRFWSVPVTSLNYQHSVNMQQLWAEVLELYRAGEQWHLTEREAEALRRINTEHEQINPVEEAVTAAFERPTEADLPGMARVEQGVRMTASEVAKLLSLDYGSKRVVNEIADVLRKFTGEAARRSGGGRYWVLQPTRETRQLMSQRAF